jgi:predicted nucleotidyltransferase
MSINYYEVELEKVKEAVKEVLEKYDYILIAVIFGSVLRRRIVRDVDIGIITSRPLAFRELTEIASQLEEKLSVEIDIVPLEEAPPLLRYKALSEGLIVINRDPKKYHYLLSEAFMELNDFEISLKMASKKPSVQ